VADRAPVTPRIPPSFFFLFSFPFFSLFLFYFLFSLPPPSLPPFLPRRPWPARPATGRRGRASPRLPVRAPPPSPPHGSRTRACRTQRAAAASLRPNRTPGPRHRSAHACARARRPKAAEPPPRRRRVPPMPAGRTSTMAAEPFAASAHAHTRARRSPAVGPACPVPGPTPRTPLAPAPPRTHARTPCPAHVRAARRPSLRRPVLAAAACVPSPVTALAARAPLRDTS